MYVRHKNHYSRSSLDFLFFYKRAEGAFVGINERERETMIDTGRDSLHVPCKVTQRVNLTRRLQLIGTVGQNEKRQNNFTAVKTQLYFAEMVE